MKQKQMTIAALACGAICALCIAGFLYSVQGEANAARAEALARYGGEQVEVCVATRTISAGERLDASAVETRLWVADLLPEGALSQSDAAIGRTATSSILKGEVISEKRFEEAQGSLDIPAGLEAVSVPTKAVQAVGGAIRAGMNVDVYSLGSSGTSALARDVVVLATSMGESGSLVSNDTGWVTLAVHPEQVEEVIAASGKTTLYFVLPGASLQEATSENQDEGGESAGPAQSAEAGEADRAQEDASTATGDDVEEGLADEASGSNDSGDGEPSPTQDENVRQADGQEEDGAR